NASRRTLRSRSREGVRRDGSCVLGDPAWCLRRRIIPVEGGGPSGGRTAPNRLPLPPETRCRDLLLYFCGLTQRMKDWSPNRILAHPAATLTSSKFPWNVCPSETTETDPSTEICAFSTPSRVKTSISITVWPPTLVAVPPLGVDPG